MATILVVDDSSFARHRLGLLFENAGHTVVGSASNGEQALSLFYELQPDVVTLDYLMTGMNGMEVLKDIISHDPNARVIMISGSGSTTLEGQFLSAGAKLFVEKFNDQSQYLKAVDQVMEA
jgi:two-component system chemotaxis response regulator CheY